MYNIRLLSNLTICAFTYLWIVDIFDVWNKSTKMEARENQYSHNKKQTSYNAAQPLHERGSAGPRS